MKYFQKFSILLLLLPLLAGTVQAKGHGLNIVTQVQVICRSENTTITRSYVQPHKIEAVLNYLRLLKCSGKADCNPEQLAGNSFTIILQDAAGQRSIYRQQANRFISKNSKPWKKISPAQANRLYPLILALPAD